MKRFILIAMLCGIISFRIFLAGISMMVIGNQDRNTDSGKLLQIGGSLLTAVWVF